MVRAKRTLKLDFQFCDNQRDMNLKNYISNHPFPHTNTQKTRKRKSCFPEIPIKLKPKVLALDPCVLYAALVNGIVVNFVHSFYILR